MLEGGVGSRPHLYDLRMGATGMEQLLSGVVAQAMLSRDSSTDTARTVPHVVYASSHDAMHFRDVGSRLNPKPKLAQANAKRKALAEEDEEKLGSSSPPSPKSRGPTPRGLHGVSRLVDEVLASSYRALHGVSAVCLRFGTIYGPHGFGATSTSVPIFHIDDGDGGEVRSAASPDVDLAETAVRGLYRRWTEDIKAREAEAEAAEDEESGEEEGAGQRRRLSSEESGARRLSLIEEAGWAHLARDRRDFVFVEGEIGWRNLFKWNRSQLIDVLLTLSTLAVSPRLRCGRRYHRRHAI